MLILFGYKFYLFFRLLSYLCVVLFCLGILVVLVICLVVGDVEKANVLNFALPLR